MSRWFSRIKASWLFVIGFVLVYFGASGAFDLASQYWPLLMQRVMPVTDTPDEGFAPWTMPRELEQAGGAPDLGQSDVPPAIELTMDGAATDGAPATGETGQTAVLPAQGSAATPQPAAAERTVQPTPRPLPEMPVWITIESIGLEAPILETGTKKTWIEGEQYDQWLAPNEFAAGWHNTSAKLGEIGNTVLNGHHNVYGKVFGNLVDIQEGVLIRIRGQQREFFYMVTNKMILPEKSVGVAQRLENARWILPSNDERLTLVTCWPYETNTHRLIIVAQPVAERSIRH